MQVRLLMARFVPALLVMYLTLNATAVNYIFDFEKKGFNLF